MAASVPDVSPDISDSSYCGGSHPLQRPYCRIDFRFEYSGGDIINVIFGVKESLNSAGWVENNDTNAAELLINPKLNRNLKCVHFWRESPDSYDDYPIVHICKNDNEIKVRYINPTLQYFGDSSTRKFK